MVYAWPVYLSLFSDYISLHESVFVSFIFSRIVYESNSHAGVLVKGCQIKRWLSAALSS